MSTTKSSPTKCFTTTKYRKIEGMFWIEYIYVHKLKEYWCNSIRSYVEIYAM